MKIHWTKLMIGCLAGAAVFGMSQVTTEAATHASAGVSTLLSECLVNDADTVKTENGVSMASEPKTICGYTNLGIASVENHLNIREGAGEDTELVGALPVDAGCEILSQEGEWYQIESGKVTGYVKGEFLLTGEAAAARAEEVKSIMATSVTQTLNARVEPNTDCNIWTMIAEGESLHVIEDMGELLKVDVYGDECYISSEFVEV